jgi:hypothetical protein
VNEEFTQQVEHAITHTHSFVRRSKKDMPDKKKKAKRPIEPNAQID